MARVFPVPREGAYDPSHSARAVKANGDDPLPDAPASAGRQLDDSDREPARDRGAAPESHDAPQASAPVKQRLFAHPSMKGAREFGGLEQLLDRRARRDGSYEVYKNYFSRPFGLDPSKVTLRRLKDGSRVIGGTVIGRIDSTVPGMAAHLDFSIRPAGRGAPRIDPKPILDGWKLLEATAIYRASGRNALHGDDVPGMSIGQVMLLPKPQLERRVLADERIELYECGQDDIRSGQIDRRVLATLAFLAESGLRPSVTSLKCGHGYYTSSGNVSHHSSGNAVDIAKINGIPILGHQEPGGVTEQTVRRLMQLQGTMAPAQIISLFEIGGATFAMTDHADHIHVGFQPMFGANSKLGKQALAVLNPGQWDDLLIAPERDREPGRADRAVQVRAPHRRRARQRRPPGRVDRRRTRPPPSASSNSSSASCWDRRTGATWCAPARMGRSTPCWCWARWAPRSGAACEAGAAVPSTRRHPRPCRPPGPRSCARSRSAHGEEAADWLAELRGDSDGCDAELDNALRILNRALRARRAATADPWLAEVSADRALVVRIGYGRGEAVAEGRFGEALELPRGGDAAGEAVDGGARGALRRPARRARTGAGVRGAGAARPRRSGRGPPPRGRAPGAGGAGGADRRAAPESAAGGVARANRRGGQRGVARCARNDSSDREVEEAVRAMEAVLRRHRMRG